MNTTRTPQGINATGTVTLANGQKRAAGWTHVSQELAALAGCDAGPRLNYQTPSGRWSLIEDAEVAGSYTPYVI